MTRKSHISDKLLETNVLKLLEKPSCGYEIMHQLNKLLKARLGPSAVYPLLLKLQENGFLKSHWDTEGQKPRKIYELTTRGEANLAVNIIELKAWVAPLLTVEA